MIDQRFYKIITDPLPIFEIAKLIDVEIENAGSQDLLISSIAPLAEASADDLSFLSNQKYLDEFNKTNAGACIVPHGFQVQNNKKIVLLKSKNPYLAYSKAIDLFYRSNKDREPQIMPSAYISKTAKIGKSCYIGHNVVIEDDAVIGDNCIIESGSVVEHGVTIGARAKIGQNVIISYSVIGDDCLILSGAKIGQDGFGFASDKGVHYKIFHTGRVIIGNNVEIGANTTIDRGSMSDTVIEDLCRIDNLVQIAHNVKIGKGSVIAAQVGIAGSTGIGSHCVIGGQVGFAGHLKIGDQVQIAGGSGVGADVPDKSIIGGYPAVKIKDWHRQTIAMKSLINKDKNASN
jgi:UDP-3-O-[3-hydroxymyristoyl] glucosamine N-acyltransferase